MIAIELLAPERLIARDLRRLPDLARVTEIADRLDLSREAAARRYVELHETPLAVIFSRNAEVRYAIAGEGCPKLTCRPGQFIPDLQACAGDAMTDMTDADPRDWLAIPDAVTVSTQTLFQQSGHAMMLLVVEAEDEEDAPRFRRR